MCLMSEVHPEAKFDIGIAMARNRLAYACADAALVVECDPNSGGTWAGALEALKEGKTVYVLKGSKAERELAERGAIRIDMSFALQPDRLIRSERPTEDIPATSQLAETIRRLIGNPVRSNEELAESFKNAPATFIDPIVQAALSDGLVESRPSGPEISIPELKQSRKQRNKVITVATLFELPLTPAVSVVQENTDPNGP